MDSPSRASSLRLYETNRGEKAGKKKKTSAVEEREFHTFISLTPDLKRKSTVSLTEDGTGEKKANKVAPGCDTAEDRRNGISTALVLSADRYHGYKFNKMLTRSDVDYDQSRLLIPKGAVKSYLHPLMSKEIASQVESDKGARVIVRDEDTASEHTLVFMYWPSSQSYVLKGGWIKQFVNRRDLKVGDKVGIYCDTSAGKFHFALLPMASPETE